MPQKDGIKRFSDHWPMIFQLFNVIDISQSVDIDSSFSDLHIPDKSICLGKQLNLNNLSYKYTHKEAPEEYFQQISIQLENEMLTFFLYNTQCDQLPTKNIIEFFDNRLYTAMIGLLPVGFGKHNNFFLGRYPSAYRMNKGLPNPKADIITLIKPAYLWDLEKNLHSPEDTKRWQLTFSMLNLDLQSNMEFMTSYDPKNPASLRHKAF